MPESFANDQALIRKEFGGSVGSAELWLQLHDQPRWMRAEALVVAWRLCRCWHFSASSGEQDEEQKVKEFHNSEKLVLCYARRIRVRRHGRAEGQNSPLLAKDVKAN